MTEQLKRVGKSLKKLYIEPLYDDRKSFNKVESNHPFAIGMLRIVTALLVSSAVGVGSNEPGPVTCVADSLICLAGAYIFYAFIDAHAADCYRYYKS